MTTKTYSSKSNAIRALKAIHPELVGELNNAELAERFLTQGVVIATLAGEPSKGGYWAIKIPEGVKVVNRKIYKGVAFRRRSVEPVGITSMVHEMFDDYVAEHEEKADGKDVKPLTRKQMIARAVRDGVAYYTARTQYQKWLRG